MKKTGNEYVRETIENYVKNNPPRRILVPKGTKRRLDAANEDRPSGSRWTSRLAAALKKIFRRKR